LGFCASVTLRTANLPNGMSFSLPYSFLSFCQLCRALLGAPLLDSLFCENTSIYSVPLKRQKVGDFEIFFLSK